MWLSQIISQFGDRLTQMAIIGLVYKRSGGVNALALTKIMFFVILPVLLINPLAGVYVDRWDKRITMFVSDFLRGVIVLVLALFMLRIKSMIPIYLTILLASAAGRFFIPAKMSLVPNLTTKGDIYLANSLISVTANVAAVFGLGLGGLIVERWGPKGGFLIDAGTFFLSSLCVFLIPLPLKAHNLAQISKDVLKLSREIVEREKSLLNEFKEGIKYIVSHKDTVFSLKVFFILFSFLGSLYAVFIAFIQSQLHSATKDLGFLAIWLGMGLFVGSLVYGRIGDRFSASRSIYLMLFVDSLILIMFALSLKYNPSRITASVFSFFLGSFASPILVGANALIHKKSDGNFWGRIFSSLEVVMHFAFLLFMFLASFLADKFGYFTIIVSTAIIIAVFSASSFIKHNVRSSPL